MFVNSDESNNLSGEKYPASDWPAWKPPVAVRMVAPPAHPCSYLPDRSARMRAFHANDLPAELYHAFMDAGFRRSGKIVYQPICTGCRACLPIRVRVADFKPSRSQRRCRARNLDLLINVDSPQSSDEKFNLYNRYLTQWHESDASTGERESFESFLYDSPVRTLEFTYRDHAGKLLAVGLCDVCPEQSLSSVYFYFDPAQARRGLGTFGALHEIEFARQQLHTPYYYMGYWVKGCAAMEYKSSFGPSEVLYSDGVWRRFDDAVLYRETRDNAGE